MPLGKYKDFAACHGAKMREGLSSAAADRYCGALQQQIEGGASSLEQKPGASYNNMSFPPKQEQEEKPEDGGNVSVPKNKAEALVSAIMNDDLQTAKRIAADIFDIEEEEAAPNKPPATPPMR